MFNFNIVDLLGKIDSNLDSQEENLKDLAEQDLEENDVEDQAVSDQSIIDKIPTFTSKKLCEIIVCNRYINYNKNLAIKCMEELSKRRQGGDDFDFESYIEKSLSELPKLNFGSSLDLREILSNMVKNK